MSTPIAWPMMTNAKKPPENGVPQARLASAFSTVFFSDACSFGQAVVMRWYQALRWSVSKGMMVFSKPLTRSRSACSFSRLAWLAIAVLMLWRCLNQVAVRQFKVCSCRAKSTIIIIKINQLEGDIENDSRRCLCVLGYSCSVGSSNRALIYLVEALFGLQTRTIDCDPMSDIWELVVKSEYIEE